jgi:hypothetical protein
MKELQKKESDKIENVKQTKQETQFNKIGSLKPKKNHKLFEINISEKTIVLAEFQKLDTAIKWEYAVKGLISVNKKVMIKENCLYISAMNKKNVIKILRRDFGLIFNK